MRSNAMTSLLFRNPEDTDHPSYYDNKGQFTFFKNHVQQKGTFVQNVELKYFDSKQEFESWLQQVAQLSGAKVDYVLFGAMDANIFPEKDVYQNNAASIIGYNNIEKISDIINKTLPTERYFERNKEALESFRQSFIEERHSLPKQHGF